MLSNTTQRGFTLIEVIVVMAIISFVLTIATISIGDPQVKRMKQQTERIASLVQIIKEQAIFNSQDYALSIWESGYSFYTYNEAGWVPVRGDRIFRERELPQGLQLVLYLEGVRVNLDRNDSKKPQIFITSDGEISPFQIELTDLEEWTYQLNFDEFGEFELLLAEA